MQIPIESGSELDANQHPSQITAYPSSARRWNFANVTFTLRNPAGDTLSFAPWSGTYTTNPCMVLYGYRVTGWTWPQGPSLTFASNWGEVSSVTSSLGRTMTGLNGALGQIGTRTAGLTAPAKIVDSAGAEWTYGYTSPVTRSATQRPIPYSLLYRIHEPVNPTQPALEYSYDSVGRVKEARDAVALQQGTRGPHVFYLGDRARSRRVDPAGGSYTVYYDTAGDAVRFIDELGRTFTATYDGRHRVTSRTYLEGDKDEFGYDTRDNLTSLLRKPKPGFPGQLTLAATYETTWNKIASFTDARGNTTSFTYRPSGSNGASQLATVTRPTVAAGTPVYTFGYNAIGLVNSETDPTNRCNTHAYNAVGDRTSTTVATLAAGGQPALNLTTTFTPDAWGDITVVTDPRGNARSTAYDAARRPTLVKHHNGGSGATPLAATRTTYDGLGRVTELEGALTFTAGGDIATAQLLERRAYTPTGQLESTQNGAGDTTLYAYDALDRLSQTTDPVGRISRNEYDAAGQLLKVIRAYGTPLQQDYARYGYTANGQRASLRDANDNRSVYVYDSYDRLCRLYFPVATLGTNAANTGGIQENQLTCTSGGTSPDYEGYGYDENGNRTSLRLRSGETIGFTFDVLDRPTVKDIPGGTAADVYTTYDLAGRVLSQRFVTYTYDAMNRVDLVRQSGTTLLADYDYHALGQHSKLTRGNGAVTDFSFDTAQRLTGLVHDLPGSADDQAYGIGYTQASQVSMQSASNAAYTWSAPAVSGRSYARNGLNQYTSVGGISFTHDARGNLTQDGSRTLAYDLENRLLTVSGPASLSLNYDPAGRLRQSVAGGATTQFLYSGSALVAEYDGAGTVLRRYVHGPGVDEPIVWYEGAAFADPRYLIADRQGSIIATRGASTVRHKYGPYGEPDAWAGSRFRYTGQIALPEAGLYHYKARVYDPALGRFLQTDPVGYADDVNLYAYVGNDPENYVDPSGLCEEPIAAGFGNGCIVIEKSKAPPKPDVPIVDATGLSGVVGINAPALIGDGREMQADFTQLDIGDLGGSLQSLAAQTGSSLNSAILSAAASGEPSPVALTGVIATRHSAIGSNNPLTQRGAIGRFQVNIAGSVTVADGAWRMTGVVTGVDNLQSYTSDSRRDPLAARGTSVLGAAQRKLGGSDYTVSFFGSQTIIIVGKVKAN